MEGLTKEQKDNLATWAGQRDSLLLEISNLRREEENLRKSNIELASSNTDIEKRANEVRGRIDELRIKESELPLVILKEVAFLESKKAVLQAEISIHEKLIETLSARKKGLESDISLALATFDVVKGETLLLDKVVHNVTEVSSKNTAKIETLVANLATSLEEIIEVNRKNVFETNVVIQKLPAMIMEAQKHGLIKNKI